MQHAKDKKAMDHVLMITFANVQFLGIQEFNLRTNSW